MISIASRDAFGGFRFAPLVRRIFSIRGGCYNQSVFDRIFNPFFPIKATHLFYRFFISSDQKKDSKYTNNVDVNNELSSLTHTTPRPKNITAVVAAMVDMSGTSPIGFLTSSTVGSDFF